MEVWSLVGKITMNGFSKAEAQLTSLEKKVKANEKAFKALRTAGIALIAMTAAIAGGALKAAIDFETAFAGVKKTVNATEDQFAALKQEIRDISKTLPVTATEIAGVAEAAGQLGIATEDIKDFTEVMIKLGMATNLSAADAATALARFANITGLAASDYENLGAAIVDLGNNSATTESEIVDMAMRLAGAGTTAGLSQQEILALSAALSSMGLRAEAGGTAVSQVFLTMNSAVLKGGDELKKFADIAGMSASEFAGVYRKDASSALVEVISGLGRMNDEGEDAAGALEGLGLGGIRITDTMLRASNSQGILTDSIKTANDAWDANSALQEEVDKRNETAAAKLTILKNKAVDIAVTVGDALIPALTTLMNKISPIIDGIGSWIKENQGLVTWLLAIAGTGGALLLFAGLLPKFIGLLVGAKNAVMLLSNVTKIATGIQWLWNAALAANPIGLVVVAVAALATAVFSFYKEVRQTVAEFTTELNADIKAKAAELTETIKGEYDEQLEAKLEQLEAEKTAIQSAHDAEVKDLIELYGFTEEMAEENAKSLVELAEEATDEKKDLLDEELKATQKSTAAKVKSLNKEQEEIRDAHYERLEMIDEEFAARLKLLDEETRAAILEQQEKIDAIKDEQEEIDTARREEDEAEKVRQLKAAVTVAETAEEEARAEQELADYLEELREDKADRDREAEIESIENTIDTIKTKAEAKEDAIKAEQAAAEQAAEEEYNRQVTALEAQIEQQNNLLQETIDRIADEKIALDVALAEEVSRLAEELAEKIKVEDEKLIVLNQSLADQANAIRAWHAEMIEEEHLYQDAIQRAKKERGTVVTAESAASQAAFNKQVEAAGGTVTPYQEYLATWPPTGLEEYATGATLTRPTVLTDLATGVPFGIAAEKGAEHIVPDGKGGNVNQTFNVNAVVREEADINKIARELFRLQQRGLRSTGVNG